MASLLRVLVVVCGVLLVVLGFLDYHVQVGAIVVGLVLVGGLSGERLIRLVGGRPRDDDEPAGRPPAH